jgi:hypothetical protein
MPRQPSWDTTSFDQISIGSWSFVEGRAAIDQQRYMTLVDGSCIVLVVKRRTMPGLVLNL